MKRAIKLAAAFAVGCAIPAAAMAADQSGSLVQDLQTRMCSVVANGPVGAESKAESKIVGNGYKTRTEAQATIGTITACAIGQI
jgi:type IV secretory pathway TrbL component